MLADKDTRTRQPRRIALVGSTGSIGTQTVDILAAHPDRYSTSVLVAGRNVMKLASQARRLGAKLAIIADSSRYDELRELLAGTSTRVAAGASAIAEAMERDDVDMVVTATVGYSGLEPTIHALRAGKDIALANKETLVVAGELIERLRKQSKSRIIPVDSEHSAIYQSLQGEDPGAVSRLILTASGGPFRGRRRSELAGVTAADALRHPNWKMGAKITVDSATMMNKAFEIIEAKWLFGIAPNRIEAWVHPQSIVHSMVEFRDGAIKAQLGVPDMHIPISYALGMTERFDGVSRPLSIEDMATMTFERPDEDAFPCIGLSHKALSMGGTAPCVINAANEVAVEAFLRGRIPFLEIFNVICHTVAALPNIKNPELADLVAMNREGRRIAADKCGIPV